MMLYHVILKSTLKLPPQDTNNDKMPSGVFFGGSWRHRTRIIYIYIILIYIYIYLLYIDIYRINNSDNNNSNNSNDNDNNHDNKIIDMYTVYYNDPGSSFQALLASMEL